MVNRDHTANILALILPFERATWLLRRVMLSILKNLPFIKLLSILEYRIEERKKIRVNLDYLFETDLSKHFPQNKNKLSTLSFGDKN